MNEAEWRAALMGGMVVDTDDPNAAEFSPVEDAPLVIDDPWDTPPWEQPAEVDAEDMIGQVLPDDALAFTEEEAAMSPEDLARAELGMADDEEPYTFEEAVINPLSPEQQAAQSRLMAAEEGADVWADEPTQAQGPQLGPDDQPIEPGFITEMRREQWEDENFHKLPYPQQVEIANRRIAKEEKRLDEKEQESTLENIDRLRKRIAEKDEIDKKIAAGREKERQKREELLNRDVEPNIPLGSQIAGVIAAAIQGWLNPGGENGAVKMLAALAQESVRIQEADINRGLKSVDGQMSLLGEMERASNNTFDAKFASEKAILDFAQKRFEQERARLQKGGTGDMVAKMARASIEHELAQIEEKQRRAEEAAEAKQRREIALEEKRTEGDIRKANVEGSWDVKQEWMRQRGENTRQEVSHRNKVDLTVIEHEHARQIMGEQHALGMSSKAVDIESERQKRVREGTDIPWDSMEYKNPNGVVIPVGEAGEEFIGVFRNPKYGSSAEGGKIRTALTASSETIRQLDELIAIEKELGGTYSGPGAEKAGGPLRRRAMFLQTSILANYAKSISGAAISEPEMKRLMNVVPKLKSWITSGDPAAARDMLRKNMIASMRSMTTAHLIKRDGIDFDSMFRRPSFKKVKSVGVETYLRRAMQRTNSTDALYTPEQRKEFIRQGILSTGEDRDKAAHYMVAFVNVLEDNVVQAKAKGTQSQVEREIEILEYAKGLRDEVYGTPVSQIATEANERFVAEGRQPFTDKTGDAAMAGVISGWGLSQNYAGIPGTAKRTEE